MSSLPPDLPESVRLSVEALDRAASGRQQNPFRILHSTFPDKYAFEADFEIDCAGRIELCRAACCKLAFFLSVQDLEEGVVRAHPEAPDRIAQDSAGVCVHLEKEQLRRTIYAARPLPCRAFDCREDRRIWIDFKRREINPAVREADWPCQGRR